MIEIYNLKDKPELLDIVVQLFWGQWGSSTNYSFYKDCMQHAMGSEDGLPRFYIAMQEESIIGTYAILRNDLISRQDLCPWLACLFVRPSHRGQHIGKQLLQHALQETCTLGCDKLYLCTDLEGYYEKYGWTYLTNGYMFNGEETKIYTASATLISQ